MRPTQRTKQICGLWRMETLARGEGIRPQQHFLHVLSPVDKGVLPPESRCIERNADVVATIRTAKGRTVTLTLKKLGQPPRGHIRIERPDERVDRDFTRTIDRAGAQPETLPRSVPRPALTSPHNPPGPPRTSTTADGQRFSRIRGHAS